MGALWLEQTCGSRLKVRYDAGFRCILLLECAALAAAILAPDAPVRVPPLSDALQKLLSLSASERDNFRLLELIVLKDPAGVARLLTLANSPVYGARRRVQTVGEALQLLGSAGAYDALLLTWTHGLVAPEPALAPVANHLLRHTFSMCATVRRVLNYVEVDDVEASFVGLVVILDKLGLSLLLTPQQQGNEPEVELLRQLATQSRHDLHAHAELTRPLGWSVNVARGWGVDPTIERAVTALAQPQAQPAETSDIVQVVWLCELLLDSTKNPASADALKRGTAAGAPLFARLAQQGLDPFSLAARY